MAALDCAYCGNAIDTDGDWVEAVVRKMFGGTGFARYSESLYTDSYHVKCWDKHEEQI